MPRDCAAPAFSCLPLKRHRSQHIGPVRPATRPQTVPDRRRTDGRSCHPSRACVRQGDRRRSPSGHPPRPGHLRHGDRVLMDRRFRDRQRRVRGPPVATAAWSTSRAACARTRRTAPPPTAPASSSGPPTAVPTRSGRSSRSEPLGRERGGVASAPRSLPLSHSPGRSIQQRLFGPDRPADGGVAAGPALGHLGDEQQSASALVENTGPPQVRGGAAAVGDFSDQHVGADEP